MILRFFYSTFVFCCLLAMFAGCKDSDREQKAKLKRVAVALHQKVKDQGQFPSNPTGENFALYELANQIPASEFDLVKKEQNATWNHARKCIENADFLYLNAPVEEWNRSIIVLVSKSTNQSGYRWLLLSNGMVKQVLFEGLPTAILGCFYSDGLIFEREIDFEKWLKFSLNLTPHSVLVASDGNVERTWTENVSIDYQYKNNRLWRRIISKEGTRIIEELNYNSEGLVNGVQRL